MKIGRRQIATASAALACVVGFLSAAYGQSANANSDVTTPTHAHLDASTVSGPIALSADLSTRRLTVRAGDSTLRSFSVAIGQSSKPTPTGTFKIRKIVWNPAWIPPDAAWAKDKKPQAPGAAANPMKVAKIFFQEPDFYIHGTGDTESLGSADSHGCLRMDPDDVAELARFLMEHDGQAQEEGWFSRIVHMRWQTHTVMLTHPVTLTISD